MSDHDLRDIHISTLVFLCAHSAVKPRAAGAAPRARLISHCTVEVVPDSGHMLPIEQPALFNSRLLAFLHDIDH